MINITQGFSDMSFGQQQTFQLPKTLLQKCFSRLQKTSPNSTGVVYLSLPGFNALPLMKSPVILDMVKEVRYAGKISPNLMWTPFPRQKKSCLKPRRN